MRSASSKVFSIRAAAPANSYSVSSIDRLQRKVGMRPTDELNNQVPPRPQIREARPGLFPAVASRAGTKGASSLQLFSAHVSPRGFYTGEPVSHCSWHHGSGSSQRTAPGAIFRVFGAFGYGHKPRSFATVSRATPTPAEARGNPRSLRMTISWVWSFRHHGRFPP